MYISTTDIQTTLDTQLKTVAGLPRFSEENQAAEARNVNPYCRSTLSQAQSTVASLGRNPVIAQKGLYQIDLFYPVAYGFQPARTVADAVIAAFPPGALLMPDGVNQLMINTAWSLPGNTYNNESAFWHVPIRVEWWITK
jgi:Bacteriophage related domain of unknown function